jgi:hypothetical protein
MQARKAHSLIGQVYDPRNLARAWERVKENKGAGGVDGVLSPGSKRTGVATWPCCIRS